MEPARPAASARKPGELQSQQRDRNNSASQADSLKRRRKIAKTVDKCMVARNRRHQPVTICLATTSNKR
jgi:hypothetical protein